MKSRLYEAKFVSYKSKLDEFKIAKSKERRCQLKVSHKDLKGQENMTKQRI